MEGKRPGRAMATGAEAHNMIRRYRGARSFPRIREGHRYAHRHQPLGRRAGDGVGERVREAGGGRDRLVLLPRAVVLQHDRVPAQRLLAP